MATQTIIPADVVTAAKHYMSDITATQYGKRVPDKELVSKAIKLRYFLKALDMPDITVESKNRIYQLLLCMVPVYNVDTVNILS